MVAIQNQRFQKDLFPFLYLAKIVFHNYLQRSPEKSQLFSVLPLTLNILPVILGTLLLKRIVVVIYSVEKKIVLE